MGHYRILAAAVAAAALAAPQAAANLQASAAQQHVPAVTRRPGNRLTAAPDGTLSLPAPPRPSTWWPAQRSGYRPPTALLKRLPGSGRATARGSAHHAPAAATTVAVGTAGSTTAGSTTAGSTTAAVTTASSTTAVVTSAVARNAVAAPAQAVTWGAPGSASTLVVYDTTDTWGYLGELYAMAGGNLASHFGQVTAEPVVDYASGQVNNFTSTIYIGSTYNEPIPAAFLNDVLSTTRPVIWAADNVWQLSGTEGGAADQAFKAAYGWDPSASYFDTTDNPATVTYKGQTFGRDTANGADILAPDITTPAAVTVLGQANCSDVSGAPVNCAPVAQTVPPRGTSFPWAIRSANLTYVGEVPFSYISESDRYVAFSDLLFAALAPTAAPAHQALVRLEDVDPKANPTALRRFADYLSSQHVPFSVGVIPEYTDPNGYYDGGVPQTITLAQAPAVVSALEYMHSKGGTIIEHGYTHQDSNVANPYDGVTGDDAEFYRAQCSATQSPPYRFESPCQNSDWVVWTGPVPGDSTAWAVVRVEAGRQLFTLAGLAAPTIWETPHYFASAADYSGIDSVYATRYERELFVSGQLSGQPLDYSHIFGQFFPYVVHDVYGEQVIPENLGNFEPSSVNNNPPRPPADIIHNAQVNLAVTQGVASFFFHPTYPLSDLQQIVTGIKNLGYTFVSPASLGG
jgi:uncharacterized protein YdaL